MDFLFLDKKKKKENIEAEEIYQRKSKFRINRSKVQKNLRNLQFFFLKHDKFILINRFYITSFFFLFLFQDFNFMPRNHEIP